MDNKPKTKEAHELGFTYTTRDVNNTTIIVSVINLFQNSKELSVGDRVKIKNHSLAYDHKEGVIEKIIYSHEDNKNSGILKIKIKDELISARLDQVYKMPPKH